RGCCLFARQRGRTLSSRIARPESPAIANARSQGAVAFPPSGTRTALRASGQYYVRHRFHGRGPGGALPRSPASTLRGEFMSTVQVETPGGSYPIHIAAGRLDALAESMPDDATAIALVSNPTVYAQYGQRASQALAKTGKRVVYIELPDGEAYKDWQTLNLIFDGMLQNRLDRKAVLVALGGGVIGDMGGFAAASYMRGIRFIQVP